MDGTQPKKRTMVEKLEISAAMESIAAVHAKTGWQLPVTRAVVKLKNEGLL